MKNTCKRLLALSMATMLSVAALAGCADSGTNTDSSSSVSMSTPGSGTQGLLGDISGEWVSIAQFKDGNPSNVDEFMSAVGVSDEMSGYDGRISILVNEDGSFSYEMEGNSVKGKLEPDGLTFTTTLEDSDITSLGVYDKEKDMIYETAITKKGSFYRIYTRKPVASEIMEGVMEVLPGKWTVAARAVNGVMSDYAGEDILGEEFEFNEDGTCKLPMGEGEYEIEGNLITIRNIPDDGYLMRFFYDEDLGVLVSGISEEKEDQTLMTILSKQDETVEAASVDTLGGTWEPEFIFDGCSVYKYDLLETIHANLFDNSNERSYYSGIKFNEGANSGMLMYGDSGADNFAYEVGDDGKITLSFPEGEEITLPMQYGNTTGYLYDYSENGEFPAVIIYKKK